MGRIESGGGEDGEPDLSLPGWLSFAGRVCHDYVWHAMLGYAGRCKAVSLAPACPEARSLCEGRKFR